MSYNPANLISTSEYKKPEDVFFDPSGLIPVDEEEKARWFNKKPEDVFFDPSDLVPVDEEEKARWKKYNIKPGKVDTSGLIRSGTPETDKADQSQSSKFDPSGLQPAGYDDYLEVFESNIKNYADSVNKAYGVKLDIPKHIDPKGADFIFSAIDRLNKNIEKGEGADFLSIITGGELVSTPITNLQKELTKWGLDKPYDPELAVTPENPYGLPQVGGKPKREYTIGEAEKGIDFGEKLTPKDIATAQTQLWGKLHNESASTGKSVLSSLYRLVGGSYAALKLAGDMVYDTAAIPQNVVGKLFNVENIKTNSKSLKKAYPAITKAIDNFILPSGPALAEANRLSATNYYDNSITGYISEGDYANAASLLGYQVLEHLPQQAEIIGLTILTGNPAIGVSVLSAQAAGGKYETLKDKDMSNIMKYNNAVSTGLTEYLTERYLGTIPILNRLMKQNTPLFQEGIESGVKLFLKNAGYGIRQEGFEELVAQTAENIIDIVTENRTNGKLPGVFDGVGDAALIGSATGGIIGSGGTVVVNLPKPTKQEIEQEEIKQDFQYIQDIYRESAVYTQKALQKAKTQQEQQQAKLLKQVTVPETGKAETVTPETMLKMPIEQQIKELKALGYHETQIVRMGGKERGEVVAQQIKPTETQRKEFSEPVSVEPVSVEPAIEKPVEVKPDPITPTKPVEVKPEPGEKEYEELKAEFKSDPESLRPDLSFLPKPIANLLKQIKAGEASFVFAKENVKDYGGNLKKFFVAVNRVVNKDRDHQHYKRILDKQGFDVDLVKTADSRSITFKNGMAITAEFSDFKGAIDVSQLNLHTGDYWIKKRISEGKPPKKYAKKGEVKPPAEPVTPPKKVESLAIVKMDPKTIQIDETKFQPKEQYREGIIESIAKDYDPVEWEEPLLWKEPETGNLFVVRGHHRQKGVLKGNITDVSYKVLPEGTTLEEAQKYAKSEKRDVPTDLENASTVRDRHEAGESITQIAKDMPQIAPRAKTDQSRQTAVRGILNLGYLDKKGKFRENYENTNQFPSIIGKAKLIGSLRRKYPWMSNRHEDDVFTYLYTENGIKGDIDTFEIGLSRTLERMDKMTEDERPKRLIQSLRKDVLKPAEDTHSEILQDINDLKGHIDVLNRQLDDPKSMGSLVKARMEAKGGSEVAALQAVKKELGTKRREAKRILLDKIAQTHQRDEAQSALFEPTYQYGMFGGGETVYEMTPAQEAEQVNISSETRRVKNELDLLGEQYRNRVIKQAVYYKQWEKLKSQEKNLQNRQAKLDKQVKEKQLKKPIPKEQQQGLFEPAQRYRGQSPEETELTQEAKKYDSAEAFIEAQDTPPKDKVYLYRGLENKFDKDFDITSTDAPTGYSTWTDSPELARQYAGEDGFVYKIELPKSELGKEIIDNKGERALFLNNGKKAGLNNVSGEEYLVYNKHDEYSSRLISQTKTKSELTDIWNKAQTDPRILHQVKAPTFYSKALQAVQDKFPPKMASASVVNWLKKNQIKDEELYWLDIKGLTEGKKSVTREELLDWIPKNEITVTEVMKRGNKVFTAKEQEEYSDLVERQEGLSQSEYERYIELSQIKELWHSAETKHDQYQLDGQKEDYRELLLTLPRKQITIPKDLKYKIVQEPSGSKFINFNFDGETFVEPLSGRSPLESAQARINRWYNNPMRNKNIFKSPHYDEKGILAHIRFNTRYDADGNKVLFIEEFQSDWQMKGLDEGFKGQMKELTPEMKELQELNSLSWGEALTTEQKERMRILKEKGVGKQLEDFSRIRETPPAPFVSDQKGKASNEWIRLALKRMMRYGAENGFDKISWTTAEQQIDRWETNLRKNVDKIHWQVQKTNNVMAEKEDDYDGLRGSWQVYDARRERRVMGGLTEAGAKQTAKEMNTAPQYVKINTFKKGENTGSMTVPLEGETKIEGKKVTLDRLLGKSMANKIRASKDRTGTFEGDNLSIGGGVHKYIYDNAMPSIARKLGKNFDAKVGGTEIATDVNLHLNDIRTLQPSIDITSTMRESVLQGQELFEPIAQLGLDFPTKQQEIFRKDATKEEKELGETLQKEVSRHGLVQNRRRGFLGTIQGNIITAPLSQGQTASVIGHKVRSAEELATAIQLYRDPRYETLRIYFTKGDRIVGHNAISIRNPSAVQGFQEIDNLPFLAWIISQKQKVNADGYWLSHNHPTGQMKPSKQDLKFTRKIASFVSGYKGHIIIDSNQYVEIRYYDKTKIMDYAVKTKYFGEEKLLVPSIKHPYLGRTVLSQEDIAGITKEIQSSDHFTLIGINSLGRISGVFEIPDDFHNLSKARKIATFRRYARQTGSIRLVAVDTKNKNRPSYQDLIDTDALTDAIGFIDGKAHGLVGPNPSREGLLYTATPSKIKARVSEPVKPYRSKALARAHILEKELGFSKDETVLLKKAILDMETLAEASDKDIDTYINYLIEQKTGKPPIEKPKVYKKTVADIKKEREESDEAKESRLKLWWKREHGKPFRVINQNLIESMDYALQNKFGKAGKELHRKLTDAELNKEEWVKPSEVQLEQLGKKVPHSEMNIMRDLIENGGAEGMSKPTQEFIKWWNKLTQDIFEKGKKYINEDLNYIEDYFPLVLRPDFYTNINPKHERWEEVVLHVQKILTDRMGQGQQEAFSLEITFKEAEEYVKSFLDFYKTKGLRQHFLQQVFQPPGEFKHSYPLELHRDRIFPEWAYETDVMNVAHAYIDKSYTAIAYAKHLQKIDEEYKYEGVENLLDQIEQEGFDRTIAADMTAWVMQLKQMEDWEQTLVGLAKNVTSFLLSWKTSIRNLGDVTKAFAYSGNYSTMESFVKQYVFFNHKERQMAKDLIGSKHVFTQTLQDVGLGGKAATFWSRRVIAFTASEGFVRKIAGDSATLSAKHLLQNYEIGGKGRNQGYIKRQLDRLTDGLDIDRIKKRGHFTRSELLRIGNVAIRAQQPVTKLAKPRGWESNSFISMSTIFKSFGHRGFRYIKDYILKELTKHGNARPLITFVLWRAALGYGIEEVFQFLFPKNYDEEEDAVKKLWEVFLETGEFGILTDLVFAVRHAGWLSPIISIALGPAFAIGIETIWNLSKTAHRTGTGKDDPAKSLKRQAARYTVKRLPLVGEDLYKKATKPKPLTTEEKRDLYKKRQAERLEKGRINREKISNQSK